MRLLKLPVADFPADDPNPATRTEWLNPEHIETAIPHIVWGPLDPVLWLELTLTSGAVQYVLTGPVRPADLTTATEHAITHLLTP